jgi:ribose transport system ATP-binding protein
MMSEIARLSHISKVYGSTYALNDVSLVLESGEIHGLVGENGAGKSTLAKIISGDIGVFSGGYILNGKEFTNPNPKKAVQNGVCIVHQWGDFAPNLTVLENMFLGYEIRKKNRLLDYVSMKSKAKEVLSRFKIDIDLNAPAGTLTPVQQQIAAIAKALCKDAKLLIVDEGGVSLDIEELGFLVDILRNLRDKGVCILFISHLLDNVLEISDRITVMRNGKYITTVKASETGLSDLITYIVGHEINNVNAQGPTASDNSEIFLKIEKLQWIENGPEYSLSVNRGSILGFTGPAGAGKTETFKTIFGTMKKYGGRISYKGEELRRLSPRYLTFRGISYVPEDRFVDGLLLNRSIEENLSLPNLRYKGQILNKKKLRENARETSLVLNVKMNDIYSAMSELSGGNQQKIVVGKWLDDRYELYILDEPYKGIDIGAKEEINQVIRKLASQGKAIIVISTEFSDLIGLVHRLNIMVNRRIVASLEGTEIENKNILKYYQSAQEAVKVSTKVSNEE